MRRNKKASTLPGSSAAGLRKEEVRPVQRQSFARYFLDGAGGQTDALLALSKEGGEPETDWQVGVVQDGKTTVFHDRAHAAKWIKKQQEERLEEMRRAAQEKLEKERALEKALEAAELDMERVKELCEDETLLMHIEDHDPVLVAENIYWAMFNNESSAKKVRCTCGASVIENGDWVWCKWIYRTLVSLERRVATDGYKRSSDKHKDVFAEGAL